jgi:Group II intron, maturase-specific domain
MIDWSVPGVTLRSWLYIGRKSLDRARDRLRETTRRNRGISLERTVAEANRFIVGLVTYYRDAGCWRTVTDGSVGNSAWDWSGWRPPCRGEQCRQPPRYMTRMPSGVRGGRCELSPYSILRESAPKAVDEFSARPEIPCVPSIPGRSDPDGRAAPRDAPGHDVRGMPSAFRVSVADARRTRHLAANGSIR